MSRYRRQLTRPAISRLAEETSELRRELQDLVSGTKPKAARLGTGAARIGDPRQADGPGPVSHRSRRRKS